jgi:hypothetical protein
MTIAYKTGDDPVFIAEEILKKIEFSEGLLH